MPEMQQERPWHLCSLAAFRTAPLTGSCWVSGSSAFVLSRFSHVWLFVISWTVAGQPPLYFPGKNNGVDCQVLLQGIFLIQGSNSSLLCLLHWQMGSLPPVPPGKSLPASSGWSHFQGPQGTEQSRTWIWGGWKTNGE